MSHQRSLYARYIRVDIHIYKGGHYHGVGVINGSINLPLRSRTQAYLRFKIAAIPLTQANQTSHQNVATIRYEDIAQRFAIFHQDG